MRLPVLQLMLMPPAAVFLYSAYCYYHQQYFTVVQKQYQPIKFIKKLGEQSQHAKTIGELRSAYQNMYAHANKMVVDPSLRSARLVSSNIDKIEERGLWISRFKMDKLLHVNHFNLYSIVTEGAFSIGFWTNTSKTTLHKLNEHQAFVQVLDQAISSRNQRCDQIGKVYLDNLQRGFEQVYSECLQATNEAVAGLRRQVGAMRNMQKYQTHF